MSTGFTFLCPIYRFLIQERDKTGEISHAELFGKRGITQALKKYCCLIFFSANGNVLITHYSDDKEHKVCLQLGKNIRLTNNFWKN